MSAQSKPNSGMSARSMFWLRKLQSLTGIAPVGVFVILHLFTNFFVYKGGEQFTEHADSIESMPFLLLIEIFIVWLPILFHSIVGIIMMRNTHWATMSVPRGSNWAYFFQRVTGILAFAFIAVHFYQIRMAKGDTWHTGADMFNETKYILTHPGGVGLFWTFIYLIGTFAVIFHFSNGIRTFCMAWGITIGDRARKGAAVLALVVGLTLSYFAVSSIYGFWKNPCHLPDADYYETPLAKEAGLTEAKFRSTSFQRCRQVDRRPPMIIGPARAAR